MFLFLSWRSNEALGIRCAQPLVFDNLVTKLYFFVQKTLTNVISTVSLLLEVVTPSI